VKPVIIEAAINGVTRKDQNPNVPVEPDEITAVALACFDAGASIVHNHIDRFGIDGPAAAERYLEGWRPVLAARPDALLYPTVNGGGSVVDMYAHLEPLREAGALRVGLCDPGSVNLGWKNEDGAPAGGFVYTNSHADVGYQLDLNARLGVGPQFAIFEPGFLRAIRAWHDARRIPPGAMVKLYFGGDRGYFGNGTPFGLPPTRAALDAYIELLDDLPYPWSVAIIGGDLTASESFVLDALSRGAHLHVGLEDLAADRVPTNEQLVEEAVALCERVGREPATCAKAGELLGLPAFS
jgi:3-keto-5-aminohexanoate cleavage enzyme